MSEYVGKYDGAANAAALYARMSIAELQNLRAAFEMDIAVAESQTTIAFGEGRLALIAAELSKREAVK